MAESGGVMNFQFSRYDTIREIKIPFKSNKLAEFFGVLAGDGYLIERDRIHKIGITLNLTEDEDYVRYIVTLVKHLFNINPTIQIREKTHRCDILIHSKAIAQFIMFLNFPNGTKKGKLKIPLWILKRQSYIRKFLRGLMDTDGSLFFAKRGTYKLNQYPVMEIKMHDKQFINQLDKALKLVGFKGVRLKNKIQFNGRRWLEKWVREIGLKNLNLISRYLVWKRFNFCPPKTTLKVRLEVLPGWQNLVMQFSSS